MNAVALVDRRLYRSRNPGDVLDATDDQGSGFQFFHPVLDGLPGLFCGVVTGGVGTAALFNATTVLKGLEFQDGAVLDRIGHIFADFSDTFELIRFMASIKNEPKCVCYSVGGFFPPAGGSLPVLLLPVGQNGIELCLVDVQYRTVTTADVQDLGIATRRWRD